MSNVHQQHSFCLPSWFVIREVKKMVDVVVSLLPRSPSVSAEGLVGVGHVETVAERLACPGSDLAFAHLSATGIARARTFVRVRFELEIEILSIRRSNISTDLREAFSRTQS